MNDENNLENIKSKIRKLLSLSKSDNENEAYIALTKANALISQLKLDKDSLFLESVHSKSTKTYSRWRTLLGNTIAWLYGCYLYRDCDHGTFVFTGDNINSFIAGEMFSYLNNTINRISKEKIRKNAKFNFRQSFKYGMADRICDRILSLGESVSWAPDREMNIKQAENFINKSLKITTGDRSIKPKINHKAFYRGTLYGDDVSLNRQAGHTPVLQLQ